MKLPEQGRKSKPHEYRTQDEPVEHAGKLDITGRWDMIKDELIEALRS